MPNSTSPNALPLCYAFRGTFIGAGYIAHIDFSGRMLAIQETEGVWIYGVNPGAVAVGAKTLDAASLELRDTLSRAFIDFADEATSFDDFEARVTTFFYDDDQRDEWDAAVEAIRSGRLPAPIGIRRTPDPEVYVRVTPKLVTQLTPDDNPLVEREQQSELAMVA